ncbi:MAG: zinc ribbon domain-containing protein [Acidimicrobiia bacterium]|nr:zinc ribbon domain-containing protein [Acidimicrobiia bacterium]
MEIPQVDLSALLGPTESIIIGAPVVVIWLLSGIVSAVVATNKGRSGCGWFLLGFLLGPMGLILSLAVSRNQAVLEQRMVQRGEMQYCPYCAEPIRAEAIKCRYCGEGFGGDQSSSQSLYMR